jgi:hypothetical protein
MYESKLDSVCNISSIPQFFAQINKIKIRQRGWMKGKKIGNGPPG